MNRDARPAPEPFFLSTAHDERFCIFHPPAGRARGGILYLHPFAEEMNKSRRMAGLQSREFAAQGYGVLQIDLFGCGDSAGDLAEATWSQWRADALAGVQWLRDRVPGPITLWGLRLGAALAVDVARASASSAPLVLDGGRDAGRHETRDAVDDAALDFAPRSSLVLWQPVLDGAAMLKQFMRLKVASQMLSEGRAESGLQDLRTRLDDGETIEVAGYPLTRGLVAGIEAVALDKLLPDQANVHWLEVVAQPDRPLPPAARQVVENWTGRGAAVDVHCIAGPQFWNTLEITECPELVARTTTIVGEAARYRTTALVDGVAS